MTHPHEPTDHPSERAAEQYVLVTAGAVIVALTIASFWLSYAHLAEVAGQHGLGGSPTRQWAWPGTVDAFIVTGELLMLRAGLRRVTDGWAIGLTITGSVGSIALNVAGVQGSADAPVPLLDYIVAAVPPTAALLAFGVLMRQIHQLVAPRDRHHETPGPVPAMGTVPAATEKQTVPVPGPDTAGAENGEEATAGPLNGDCPDQPGNGHRVGTVPAGHGPHMVPVPEPETGMPGPLDGDGPGDGQGPGTGDRAAVPNGHGPRTVPVPHRDGPQSARGSGPKPLVSGDRPRREHARPGTGPAGIQQSAWGTEPEQPRPHPVPDGGPEGDRAEGDGDQEPDGDRPARDGDRGPSLEAKGPRSRSRLSEDEIVELVRPHIPSVLERDGNEAVTRVQLRQIMREQKITIRNDRLTPVLKRLRAPQVTNARSTR